MRKKRSYTCGNCGGAGHSRARCPELKPRDLKPENVTTETAIAIVEPAEVVAEISPEPRSVESVGDGEIVVFGENPYEIGRSQGALVAWCKERLEHERAELNEIEASKAAAESAGWAIDGWQRQANRQADRIVFYEKVLAALEAGYWLIPNFPARVYAVRTTREAPIRREYENWRSEPERAAPDVHAAIGEGHYVSRDTAWSSVERPDGLDKEGKPKWKRMHYADDYRTVDFPFKFARARVVEAASEAEVLGIFDELGVLPAPERQRRRAGARGDPAVVGIVRLSSTQHVTFLVTWFVDTRTLP